MARSKHRSKRSRRGIRSLLPKARWKRWVFGGAVLGLLGLAAVVWSLSRKVDDFLAASRAPGPIRIYSAPFVMRPGMSTEGAHLVARLRRLGYSEAAGEQLEAGGFRAGRDHIDITLRPFADPDGDPLAGSFASRSRTGSCGRFARSAVVGSSSGCARAGASRHVFWRRARRAPRAPARRLPAARGGGGTRRRGLTLRDSPGGRSHRAAARRVGELP